jgi:hypothetical protein
MRAVERFADVLARLTCAKACRSASAGCRLLVSGFPDEVIELAADRLAGSVLQGAPLLPSNVILVLGKAEYGRTERSTRASVAGVSYCVNVRDKGETAVFFVKRSLVPFIEESLGAKGSVQVTRLGITPRKVLAATVDEFLQESGWEFDDPVQRSMLRDRVRERCELLLEDDRSEWLAFEMLDEFFRDGSSLDDMLAAKGFKALGLVPQAGGDEATVKENVAEIDTLRSALAVPAKRAAHLEELREYDPEASKDLEEFLAKHGWRVPLATDRPVTGEPHKTSYRQFFLDWPDRCTLTFLKCREKGSATLNITRLRGASGRTFDRIGSVWIVDEDEAQLEWGAFQLDGCPGEAVVNGRRQAEVDDLASGRLGPIPVGGAGFGMQAGMQVELKLLPSRTADRRRLRKQCRNGMDAVLLPPDGVFAVVVIGGELAWVVTEHGESPAPPPKKQRSRTLSIAGRLYNGRQQVAAPVRILESETEEEISAITVEDGSPTDLLVEWVWEGQARRVGLSTVFDVWGDDKSRRFDSMLGAVRDAARSVERPLGPNAEFSIEWATFPHFRVRCSGMTESEFQLTCEARTDWTKDLLDRLLEQPDLMGPRAAQIARGKAVVSPSVLGTRDGVPWDPPWTSPACGAFLDARRELFVTLRKEEVPLPFLRLRDHGKLIRKYVQGYLDLLTGYLTNNGSYSPGMAYFSSLDSYLLVPGAPLPPDGRHKDADIARAVILVAPTHPVRLLWLLRREEFCWDLYRSASHRQCIDLAAALNGFGFPASVVLPDGTVFSNIGFPRDAFWGAYAPEAAPFDQALEFLAEVFAGPKEFFENPEAPAPSKILAALDYVHRVFPYRRVLRVRYPEPGTAFSLREALAQIPSGTAESKPAGLHSALFNKRRIRLVIDVNADPRRRTAAAFAEAESREVGDEGGLPQVELRRTTVDGQGAFGADVAFADGTAGREHGAVLPLDRCPASLPLGGLVCPLSVRSRLNEQATGEMRYAWVHPRPGSATSGPSDVKTLDETLSAELCHAFQTLFREPRADATIDGTKVRATRVAYRQAVLDRVRSLQSSSGFLFTLDTNSDLAMFEQMAASGDTIIIDFDTSYHNPVARALGPDSHNYVITTSAYSPVKRRLHAGLLSAFGDESGLSESATDTLFKALNGLSGRFLKELLQTPTDVKETIGCGLASLLVAHAVAGSAKSPVDSAGEYVSALIPIDDHFGRWRSLTSRLPERDVGLRADLLFVTVAVQEDAPVGMWLRIIEAKFGYGGDDAGPAAKGYVQVKNTWEVLRHWLHLRPVRREGSTMCCDMGRTTEAQFARLDIASTVDFYLRRASRLAPALVAHRTAAEMEVVCNRVYDAITQGNARFMFDLHPEPQAGRPPGSVSDVVIGSILHFDPSRDAAPAPTVKGLDPVVWYRVIGREQCLKLIAQEGQNDR